MRIVELSPINPYILYIELPHTIIYVGDKTKANGRTSAKAKRIGRQLGCQLTTYYVFGDIERGEG